MRGTVATCATGAVLLAAGVPARAGESPAPFAPAFPVTPLATLRVTGGYGELRGNHLHAGLDFSTGGAVGAAVRAPLPGAVVRVRASGAGYGRSLYLRADDGRLLVFGHLDAFAPRVAAWVDSAQRAGGEYEQDLVPAAGRFRFAAGETLAWSGESGTEAPHLHFEVRHEDFALNPLLAGIDLAPGAPPRIEALVLEPLDEGSFVRRHAAPYTLSLAPERPETLVVEGRVRAVVRARTGLGVRGAPPWITAIDWRPHLWPDRETGRVEARLDSISWAGEMSQEDLVVDRGRITGSRGFVLAAPEHFTPRFLRVLPPREDGRRVEPAAPGADTALAGERRGPAWRGVLEVGDMDPPRELVITARDAGGGETRRSVWLRAPRPGERGPDTSGVTPRPRGRAASPRWTFGSLPDGRLRVTLAGAPAGLRGVRLGLDRGMSPATLDPAGWSAVLDARGGAGSLHASGRLAGRPWELRAAAAVWESGARASAAGVAEVFTLELPPDRTFEPLPLVLRALPAPRGDAELVPAGPAFAIEPERTPLRRPATLVVPLPAGVEAERVDLYRADGGGWGRTGARYAAASRTFRADVPALGTFALLRDVAPPRVALLAPPRHAGAHAPYSRWALLARVHEDGSGVDPAASAFWVDGARVPSEWDGVRGVLRWRPLSPPAPGAHAVRVRVVDRAGNATERDGRFVLDSAGR